MYLERNIVIVLIGLISSVININAKKYGKEEKEMNLAEAANNYLRTSAALENKILQAVSYFAANKDKIPLPDESLANLNTSTIIVNPITFSQVAQVEEWLKADVNCKEIIKESFESGSMTFTVKHLNSSYDLLTNVKNKSASQLQVLEVGANGIVKLTFQNK